MRWTISKWISNDAHELWRIFWEIHFQWMHSHWIELSTLNGSLDEEHYSRERKNQWHINRWLTLKIYSTRTERYKRRRFSTVHRSTMFTSLLSFCAATVLFTSLVNAGGSPDMLSSTRRKTGSQPREPSIVDWDAHQWMAPGADDLRGPCPGLNTYVFFLLCSGTWVSWHWIASPTTDFCQEMEEVWTCLLS